MAEKKGRPDKYTTHVEPMLEKIEEMAQTMTEKQIAEALGVGLTAWKDYKKKYPALTDRLKKGRAVLVTDLRGTLIKKAKGFTYEEKRVTKENGKIVREEITTKYAQPDVAALNLALKNYDKENWANDPQTIEIRRREIELREKKREDENW